MILSCRTGVAAMAALITSMAPCAGSAVPVEAFFDTPEMSEPVLSPDGGALAILMRNKAGRRQLVVLDTTDLHRAEVAASFDDVDVGSVQWADDRRLVFRTWREEASAWRQKGSGLMAVDRDGANLRQLILPNWERPLSTGTHVISRILDPDYDLVRTLRDGSGDVLVAHWTHGEFIGMGQHWHLEVSGSVPTRLNTRTGHLQSAGPGAVPDRVFQWIADDRGQLLAGLAYEGDTVSLRVPDAGAWPARLQFPRVGSSPETLAVEEVGPDGQVYVTRGTETPEDTTGLYRLDLATGRTDPRPLVSVRGFDYWGALIGDVAHRKLLGVHYVGDGPGTAWLDPELAALQKKVDARLPGLDNTLDPAECGCARRLLVTSQSDHQPPRYFLYDRLDDRLIVIGSARPGIVPGQMSDTDFVRIKARDGEEVPTYITKPRGKGPWPAVVLVHGGPNIRGWSWRWEPQFQFLASRGYLVVAPEYRGSRGYGYYHFQAGWKQWGLAMQDDIADVTRWAAAQGLADPDRTCIAGASYGGYATLMGLVRYPELYRCGVAWAAVSDLGLMYDLWWSDTSEDWKEHGMPAMVGDKVKDAAQFEATSPLKQAARITRPLLLAHGGVDRRVPLEHANLLRAALEAHHAPLTWVLYPEEGHGWSAPGTRADWYTRMAAFLDAQTAPRARPDAAPSAAAASASRP